MKIVSTLSLAGGHMPARSGWDIKLRYSSPQSRWGTSGARAALNRHARTFLEDK